jgi:hypothetical protein
MPELDEWESFYLIVGGAAGALIGLQFVVMTLIAERPPVRAGESNAAFGTRFGGCAFRSLSFARGRRWGRWNDCAR